jgi:predicted exporter
MAREKIVRAEAIEILEQQRDKLDKVINDQTLHGVEAVNQALAIIKDAGQMVGYTPAFRCLVLNYSPEESIRWGK